MRQHRALWRVGAVPGAVREVRVHPRQRGRRRARLAVAGRHHQGFDHRQLRFDDDRETSAMADRLGQLSAAGVAVWLDDISRARLVDPQADGALDKLRREQHVVGVTSNPTIFAAAISGSDLYDGQLKDLAVRGLTVDEAVRMITTYDVRWACDVMKPAYDASNGVDGRVSIEVDPRLADQTAPT